MSFAVTILTLFNYMILKIFIKNFIVLFEITKTTIVDKIDEIKTFLTVNDFAMMRSFFIIFINFLMLF